MTRETVCWERPSTLATSLRVGRLASVGERSLIGWIEGFLRLVINNLQGPWRLGGSLALPTLALPSLALPSLALPSLALTKPRPYQASPYQASALPSLGPTKPRPTKSRPTKSR